MSNSESALVVLVPEAEPLVRPYRARFDTSAAAGLGAHITLLYPFIEPERVGESTLDTLTECFRGFAPIAFRLTAIRRFPIETLYLAPEPDEPFRKLSLAIWQRFPDRPPYGGAYPDIVPHLSIGRFTDAEEMDRIAGELAAALDETPVIEAYASTVVLIENTTGRWVARNSFQLGG
jgi:2'-5' RNA ligase superfamily